MLEMLLAKLGIPLEEAQRSFAGEGCESPVAGACAGGMCCLPLWVGKRCGCLANVKLRGSLWWRWMSAACLSSRGSSCEQSLLGGS